MNGPVPAAAERSLSRVIAASEWLARELRLRPEICAPAWEIACGRLAAQALVPRAGEPDFAASLRRLRRLLWLALALHDLDGERDPLEVAARISDYADLLIEAAHRHALWEAGAPGDLAPAIIALGKLGGRELNYASDVDLILVAGDGRSEDRRIQAWARGLVQTLGGGQGGALTLRVDLRLRPHGLAGPLVNTPATLRAYYASVAQEWEIQALLKARLVCGPAGGLSSWFESLTDRLYPARLHPRILKEMAAMRRRIETKVESGAHFHRVFHIKGSPGGLRDVEFAVQFLQRSHGHAHPVVRGGSTLSALEALEGIGALSRSSARVLREGYRLLRLVEHRQQLWADAPAYRLPLVGAAADEARLAASCGFGAPAALRGRILRRATHNREIIRRLLLSGGEALARQDLDLVDALLDPTGDFTAALAGMRELGFDDPARLRSALTLLLEAPDDLSRQRLRRHLAPVVLPLLKRLGRGPAPQGTLMRLAQTLAQLDARAAYFTAILEQPDLLELMAVLASSEFLSRRLRRFPGSLEAVVDELATWRERGALGCAATLAQQHPDGGLADREAWLRFQAEMLLTIGALDLGRRINLSEAMAALSDLAEALVSQASAGAARSRGIEGGFPAVVFALGKLGAGELNYASDLDLVVVGQVDDDRRLCGCVQDLLGLFGPQAAFPIDMRLRPGGTGAPLVVSPQRLFQYLDGLGDSSTEAQLWEALAWTRARAIAGPEELRRSYTASLQASIYRDPPLRGLATAAREMRRKLEQRAGPLDFKIGLGGIVDIEFLVQVFKLRHGARDQALRRTDTVSLPTMLCRRGLLDGAEERDLLAAYSFLRGLEGRLHIQHKHPTRRLPAQADALRALAQHLGYQAVGARAPEHSLLEEYRYHTHRVRKVFERRLRELEEADRREARP